MVCRHILSSIESFVISLIFRRKLCKSNNYIIFVLYNTLGLFNYFVDRHFMKKYLQSIPPSYVYVSIVVFLIYQLGARDNKRKMKARNAVIRC